MVWYTTRGEKENQFIACEVRGVIRSADIRSSDQNPDLNAIRIIIFLIE